MTAEEQRHARDRLAVLADKLTEAGDLRTPGSTTRGPTPLADLTPAGSTHNRWCACLCRGRSLPC